MRDSSQGFSLRHPNRRSGGPRVVSGGEPTAQVRSPDAGTGSNGGGPNRVAFGTPYATRRGRRSSSFRTSTASSDDLGLDFTASFGTLSFATSTTGSSTAGGSGATGTG